MRYNYKNAYFTSSYLYRTLSIIYKLSIYYKIKKSKDKG